MIKTKTPRNKINLKSTRSKLRASMPLPEVILWQKLRNKRLGCKFRRQYSIGNHILDFYAPLFKLNIEIDGDTHFRNTTAVKADKLRDNFLLNEGIRVLRFTNNDVMKKLEAVIGIIKRETTPS